MKQKFSTMWRKSKQPRKQRKYRINAPLHIKQKFLASHLSKELRKKHGKRSLRSRKGDRVKVVVGQFKGKTGKVDNIDVRNIKIYVEGIEVIKKDGTKRAVPFNPSNVIITELNLDDKKREEKIRKAKPKKAGKSEKPKEDAEIRANSEVKNDKGSS